MSSYPDLVATLPRLPVLPFSGTLYRAINHSALYGIHSTSPYVPDPLYCDGAPAKGARFTPKGGMPSIYFAEDRATADLEANQAYLAVQQVNPAAVPGPPSTVLFTARVQLDSVLDLADPVVQTALGTNRAELAAPYRLFQVAGQSAPTQELGKAVFDTRRAQAIRYPSAVPSGGYCFAIFCELLAPTGFIEIYDPGSPLARRIP